MQHTPEELLVQIDHLITVELQKCNGTNTPHVCRLKSTPEGAEAVRESLIRKCAETGCSVGQAIIELEQEYGFTGND